MQLPAWTLKFLAGSVVPALIGVSVAISAPSGSTTSSEVLSDAHFTIGADGVDFTMITGPRSSGIANSVPACADPARRGILRPC